MAEIADQLTTEEKSAIQKFKEKAREFWTLYQSLDSKRDIVSQLPDDQRRKYYSLMSRGSTLKTTVETITGAIDQAAALYESVKNWLVSTFGFGEIRARNELNQLGIAPLVVIGGAVAIAAAASALTAWVSDAAEANMIFSEVQRLQAQGVPIDQAYEMALSVRKPGFFDKAGNLIMTLIIGGAVIAFIILPRMKKA